MPTFDHFADALRKRLSKPLPGFEAQRTMAPRYDVGQRGIPTDEVDCTDAGVLALLYPDDQGTPTVLLTIRRSNLAHHPGQISFPGGRCEPGETECETALREAQEEVGLPPEEVSILGALTPLYIPPSGFCAHPFVGMLPYTPQTTPQEDEVEALLPAHIPHLLHPGTRTVETWTLHGTQIDVPFYDVEGHTVWGATAMMLAELLDVVRSTDALLHMQ
ncbi:MAG: CoA pyrophosphatase [Longimonas sp.]|uniref:NUDIX hydrolase n=1 Tax=Longimonas sp. TaxID=2039626 RepID=UPI00334770E2